MTEDQAKKYLQDLASYQEIVHPSDLIEIAGMLQSLRDELDSVWQMIEEMKNSDTLNYQKEITQRLNDLLKEKSKIAKVSEA